jgi:hypothetical protein
MNNNPIWADFPKREIICTTAPGTATYYGNTFIVYPKNGAKIGICPGVDIWGENFEDYNDMLHQLFSHRSLGGKMPWDNNYRLFTKACELVDDNKDKIKRDKKFMSSVYREWLFDEYFSSNISLMDFIGQNFFSPEKFRWMYIKDFKVKGDHEVWTDTSCILRPEDYEI